MCVHNNKMVKFIQAVETHPILWETTNKDFKDKNKNLMQQRIWKDILDFFLSTQKTYF